MGHDYTDAECVGFRHMMWVKLGGVFGMVSLLVGAVAAFIQFFDIVLYKFRWFGVWVYLFPLFISIQCGMALLNAVCTLLDSHSAAGFAALFGYRAEMRTPSIMSHIVLTMDALIPALIYGLLTFGWWNSAFYMAQDYTTLDDRIFVPSAHIDVGELFKFYALILISLVVFGFHTVVHLAVYTGLVFYGFVDNLMLGEAEEVAASYEVANPRRSSIRRRSAASSI